MKMNFDKDLIVLLAGLLILQGIQIMQIGPNMADLVASPPGSLFKALVWTEIVAYGGIALCALLIAFAVGSIWPIAVAIMTIALIGSIFHLAERQKPDGD